MRLSVVAPSGTRNLASIGPAPIVVGSGPAADVRLTGDGIRPAHVRLSAEWVEALAPCTVGGIALDHGARRLLVPFVEIRVGDARLFLEEDEAPSVPTRDLAFGALLDGVSLWPSVVVASGPGAGKRLVLRDERQYVIGRTADADLQLDHPTVSRVHVELRRLGGAVHLRDRGATGGTFLGEHRIAPDKEASWTPHRMVRAGEVVLALSIPGFSDAARTDAAGADGHVIGPPPSQRDVEASPSSTMLADGSLHSVPSQRIVPAATQAAIVEISADPQAPLASPPTLRRSKLEILGGIVLAVVIVAALGVLAYLVAS